MGNELAVYRPQELSLDETITLGKVLARSGFFRDANDEAKAVAKILAGRELGFGPMASMTGINVIQGKIAIGANLMAAAVKGSGKYTYRVRKLDNSGCSIEFFERGDSGWESLGESTYTIEDAKRAGLANKDNWKKMPRNMLFARALSNGIRWYAPDISGGPLYTPEELGAPVNADGEPVQLVDSRPEYHASKDDSIEVLEGEFREETEKNIAASEPMITKAQLKALHAYGRQFYGDEWDAKRHGVLKHYGLASSKDLTREQASGWIDMLVDKINQRAAAEAVSGMKFNDAGADTMEAEATAIETEVTK